MTTPSHETLDYASPPAERYDWEQGGFLLTAFICGIVPMVVGTIALVGYAITCHDAFAGAGAVTIFVGVFIFLIGMGILLSHAIVSWHQRRRPIRRWLVPNLLLAGLLLANFPLAAVYVVIGERLMRQAEDSSLLFQKD